MLFNDEIISTINRTLKNKTLDEDCKIEWLSSYYNQINLSTDPKRKMSLAKSSYREYDWVYIFSKIYPNSYYYNLPKVRVWLVNTIYNNLDDISKIVLKQLVIFGNKDK